MPRATADGATADAAIVRALRRVWLHERSVIAVHRAAHERVVIALHTSGARGEYGAHHAASTSRWPAAPRVADDMSRADRVSRPRPRLQPSGGVGHRARGHRCASPRDPFTSVRVTSRASAFLT